MGRELFDFAFKEYAQRWMFKHPTPADFFRTMEDASGFDLDWFWRGWFYTTDNVDISMENVSWYQPNTQNPDIENVLSKAEDEKIAISDIRNKTEIIQTVTEVDNATLDFYTTYDKYRVTENDRKNYGKILSRLSDDQKELLNGNYNFYQIDFKNIGGLVMPLILKFDFEDGTEEVWNIPAEIWRRDNYDVSKVFMFEKVVSNITLDPYLETADVDLNNNFWPPKKQPSRFKLFKMRNSGRSRSYSNNPMRDAEKKKIVPGDE
jgi:aminopeptidase N